MTAHTKIELRNEILENLGIKQQGQPVSAEDAAKADKVIQAALEYLEDESVVIFDPQSSSSVIPAKVYLHLSDYVESYLAPAFGKPRDIGLREDAFRRVRRVALKADTDGPTPIENY